jgi:hypothetical protein
MSNVKAQYQELVNLLEANKNKKVSTILPQIMELVTTKQKSRTFIKDDEGNILAIYCYYHKRWERLDECEYGKKASSSHGYNTMCKEGTSQWTKQQREAKKAKEQLLTQLANGEITQDELTSLMDEIEEQRTRIIPREDGLGAIDEQA